MAFEKEYVMVEKRAVEINAFADEMDANRNMVQGALARRYTTQGRPAPAPGVEPPSPSRALQVVAGRPLGTHQRAGSFERRYAPSPQSATNMLTKALNAANVRLFGALGTSPPFGKGPSPPRGYGAFPAYPTPQGQMLLSDGNESKTPVDEDTKIVRTMEDAGHRSGVVFGFAEVKYRQLLPATPSTQDALGIQQIGMQEKLTSSGGEEDQDMTTIATVAVAEEALVLYVKTLAILAKTIDLAGYWWNKQNRVEALPADPTARPPNSNSTEVGKRMNNVVQWARSHFNECLEKSEIVGRKLQQAQRELPLDHPGHPSNHKSTSSTGSGAVTTSAEHIQITSGVTAEKLMFERAVEMSRAAAVSELVGEELRDCEISYVTAIMLLEAVLESDDEPLIRRPSAKKDKPGDELINGMETEDRQTVIKRASITSLSLVMRHEDADYVRGVIESARSRLHSIRKKILAAQEAAKRGPASQHPSGNVTPRAGNNVSPALTPAVGGTPPK
jgi:serine/threonine-protein kinase ULK/ATG1